jgi:hypothetical protein
MICLKEEDTYTVNLSMGEMEMERCGGRLGFISHEKKMPRSKSEMDI